MSKHKNIKGWALRKSNIPHQPYHIIDDFGEMVQYFKVKEIMKML